MKRILAISALAAAVTAAPAALAHHSYAMFDNTKEVEVTGTVHEWQWTSPHVYLYVVAPGSGAEPDKYTVEGGNPGQLRRDGYGKGIMAPGDKVTVYMSPLRNGEKGGYINAIVLPGGKVLGTRLKDKQ